MREDADHTVHRGGSAHVDASDASMRPRASIQRGVQHAFQMDVVDIACRRRSGAGHLRASRSADRQTHVMIGRPGAPGKLQAAFHRRTDKVIAPDRREDPLYQVTPRRVQTICMCTYESWMSPTLRFGLPSCHAPMVMRAPRFGTLLTRHRLVS